MMSLQGGTAFVVVIILLIFGLRLGRLVVGLLLRGLTRGGLWLLFSWLCLCRLGLVRVWLGRWLGHWLDRLGRRRDRLLSWSHLLIFVIEAMIKKEVCRQLLVLVTREIGFGRFVLWESKLCKSVDCFHLFGRHSDRAWRCLSWRSSAHSSSGSSCFSAQDEVHESLWILLNKCK